MVTECCDETGMNPADAIVIGDAVYDMQMAKAAGARAIGVSWGYHAVTALREAGAEAIVETYGELEALLLRLGVLTRSQPAA